ncbi:MAG: double zinc ribbon domain-containing protein [Candidatus Fervidibacter sp.]|uniref:double zinc ribbon domain-containing protein n=1 Tax=Candidatus Fervidibacter sp. TaxID=3100871 RepID=UPI0040499076
MPIKCPQCGTENLDGALFCDECGASLTDVAAAQPSEPAAAEAAPAEPTPKVAPSKAAPQVVGALKCPSCGHENPPDARFCENCGATLTVPAGASVEPAVEAPPAPPVAPVAALIITETGVELPLDFSKGEVLIGRADPVSRVFPDVDLTPHGGYEAGVSRKHCRILKQGDQFLVEDLQSTNGTKLNGQFIPPNQPHPLKDGDMLELGVLKVNFKVKG